MFVRPHCPYCAKARRALERRGIEFTEQSLGDARGEDFNAWCASVAPQTIVRPSPATGRFTAPQIFFWSDSGVQYVGGSDDLDDLISRGFS